MFIKKNKKTIHSFFIQLALIQAKKNIGNTKENPSVGCVIVKNNCVISAGTTSFNGRPHAEQNALNFAKRKSKNANLYVTLEPCSHYGKTPPCVNSIIKNKIKRVYLSIRDPDARSYNRCFAQLKKRDIIVKEGIEKSKVNFFYRSYIKFKKKNLPFVTAKMAISKDFYTNDRRGKWITNELSRGRVHLMRSFHDCILTSSKTIIKDNPKLTCRIEGLEKRSPSRIILDRELIIPINSYIIKTANIYPTIIFFNKLNKHKFKKLKKLNVKLIKTDLSKDGNLNLTNILLKIKKLGFSRIFLESGLKLTSNFLANKLIDDLYFFVSGKFLKTNGNNNIKKNIKLFLNNKKYINEKVNLDNDKLILYKLK